METFEELEASTEAVSMRSRAAAMADSAVVGVDVDGELDVKDDLTWESARCNVGA